MSAQLSRDPMQDPRVGDVVQIIPPFNEPPAPLTILAVSDDFVEWQRGDMWHRTTRKVWGESRCTGGGTRSMRLLPSSEGLVSA